MASRKKSRKTYRRKELSHFHRLARFAGIIAVAFIAIYFITNIFARGSSCVDKPNRPCYDKTASGKVSLLGKNASNTFDACVSNSAPNNVGEFIIKTSVCEQEKVTYCHDGKSPNFLRKFSGDCLTTDPPPPPPTPEPSPTPTPTPTPTSSPSAKPLRITYPNGGEQLPYGSDMTIKWEGGNPSEPISLYLIDKDKRPLRVLALDLQNDGAENWVVDIPLGNYYMMVQTSCGSYAYSSFPCPQSYYQYDYGDSTFSAVAGAPVEKVNSSYPTNQSLVMLSPSGGEVWEVGSTQTIKWTGANPDARIGISLVDANDYTKYTTLFDAVNYTANDGSENWTIPSYIPPGTYKMYITCGNCSTINSLKVAYGYYPFTIK